MSARCWRLYKGPPQPPPPLPPPPRPRWRGWRRPEWWETTRRWWGWGRSCYVGQRLWGEVRWDKLESSGSTEWLSPPVMSGRSGDQWCDRAYGRTMQWQHNNSKLRPTYICTIYRYVCWLEVRIEKNKFIKVCLYFSRLRFDLWFVSV